jgi:hypothetical protein
MPPPPRPQNEATQRAATDNGTARMSNIAAAVAAAAAAAAAATASSKVVSSPSADGDKTSVSPPLPSRQECNAVARGDDDRGGPSLGSGGEVNWLQLPGHSAGAEGALSVSPAYTPLDDPAQEMRQVPHFEEWVQGGGGRAPVVGVGQGARSDSGGDASGCSSHASPSSTLQASSSSACSAQQSPERGGPGTRSKQHAEEAGRGAGRRMGMDALAQVGDALFAGPEALSFLQGLKGPRAPDQRKVEQAQAQKHASPHAVLADSRAQMSPVPAVPVVPAVCGSKSPIVRPLHHTVSEMPHVHKVNGKADAARFAEQGPVGETKQESPRPGEAASTEARKLPDKEAPADVLTFFETIWEPRADGILYGSDSLSKLPNARLVGHGVSAAAPGVVIKTPRSAGTGTKYHLVASVSKSLMEIGPRPLQQDAMHVGAVRGNVPVVLVCDGHGYVNLLNTQVVCFSQGPSLALVLMCKHHMCKLVQFQHTHTQSARAHTHKHASSQAQRAAALNSQTLTLHTPRLQTNIKCEIRSHRTPRRTFATACTWAGDRWRKYLARPLRRCESTERTCKAENIRNGVLPSPRLSKMQCL